MIYGTHYQTFITGKDLVNGGIAALKNLKVGEIAIVDETTENTAKAAISDWTAVKVFSLYEAVINDKGKRVLMKHSGAKPISVPHIRKKTLVAHKDAYPQYWMLELGDGFAACCKDYTIKFTLQSEQIQKSQFPNYYVQELSVKKACCEEACGSSENPFTNAELAFVLWYENAINKDYYASCNIMIKSDSVYDTPITAHDENGNAIFSYDDATYENIVFKEGRVYYISNGTENVANSITDFLTTVLTTVPDEFALVFKIDSELELKSGNINLKYDYIRNVKADVTLEGGFKCADGISISSNDNATNAASIYDEEGNAVSVFSYSVGSGYDVRQMEQYDSRRTVNSPYPFSKFSHSENGMQFLSDENKTYDLLTIEYTQHSDALGGEFPHPHGTTIAVESICKIQDKYVVTVVRLDTEASPEEHNWTAIVDSKPFDGMGIPTDAFSTADGDSLTIAGDSGDYVRFGEGEEDDDTFTTTQAEVCGNISENFESFLTDTLGYTEDELCEVWPSLCD